MDDREIWLTALRDRARHVGPIARAALILALALGAAAFIAHKAIPANVWEVQNATVERY